MLGQVKVVSLRITMSCVVLLWSVVPSIGYAQFRGGNVDGHSTWSSVSPLNGLPAIYVGGIGDGMHALQSVGQNQLPNLYTGGSDDGFASDQSLHQNTLAEIFSGGPGDGFHGTLDIPDLNGLPTIYKGGNNDGFDLDSALQSNPMPNIFAGGVNDGHDSVERTGANSPCSDNLFVWTGNVNEDWHESGNWECFVVPSLFSRVRIPEGLTSSGRPYPVVYSAAEVSTIRLEPGAYLQIQPGVLLKLNGQ